MSNAYLSIINEGARALFKEFKELSSDTWAEHFNENVRHALVSTGTSITVRDTGRKGRSKMFNSWDGVNDFHHMSLSFMYFYNKIT